MDMKVADTRHGYSFISASGDSKTGSKFLLCSVMLRNRQMRLHARLLSAADSAPPLTSLIFMVFTPYMVSPIAVCG